MEQTVSVVICTSGADRWDAFESAVKSVEAQRTPPDEIVLVVDHDPDLLTRAQGRWPDHTVVGNEGAPGLSGCRNTGVRAARGDRLAFLDETAVAEPDWLERLCSPLADDLVGAVGGRVAPAWTEAPPAWFPTEFLWTVGCSYTGLPERDGAVIRDPIGANMAFRRDALEAAGAFREDIGKVNALLVGSEEVEVSIRTRRLGWEVVYAPSAVARIVVDPASTTWPHFRHRCAREGRSKAVVTRFVGPDHALSVERSYATRTLPLGVLRAARVACTGPDRTAALARAGAIVAGLAVTTVGYLEGRFERRSTHTA